MKRPNRGPIFPVTVMLASSLLGGVGTIVTAVAIGGSGVAVRLANLVSSICLGLSAVGLVIAFVALARVVRNQRAARTGDDATHAAALEDDGTTRHE